MAWNEQHGLAMTIAKRVKYTGRVQGVGFRYTALGVAQNFAVAGTVRNCSDGSVEMCVQGEPDQVEAFLAALERQMHSCIAEQKTSDKQPTAVEGFHIIR
jgi:acylphosphatase